MDTPTEQHPANAQPVNDMPHAPQKNVLMAALSYIGPLVIVSYLTAKGARENN